MFSWGWTPFVDPDPMLSYFTCDQVASDPEDPTNYYNDANYCDPEYDKLYQQQKVELDRDKRVEIVHEMLTRFQPVGRLQRALHGARHAGVREGPLRGLRPAAGEDRPGPLLEHLADLRAAEAVSRASAAAVTTAAASGGIIAIVVAVRARARPSASFVSRAAAAPTSGSERTLRHGKVLGSLATLLFVICFNFFLFRVVEADPVANLYRGRNLSASQRAELDQAVRPRQVHRRPSSSPT